MFVLVVSTLDCLNIVLSLKISKALFYFSDFPSPMWDVFVLLSTMETSIGKFMLAPVRKGLNMK